MKKVSFDSKSMYTKKISKDLNKDFAIKNKYQVRLPKIHKFGKKAQMSGFMNLIVGLMFAYMVVAVLTALIPAFKAQVISATSYATGLNCIGSADYNATAAAQTGGTSATGCLALGLFIPFIVLCVLMAIIGKILYDRGAPTPGYG